ncbi:MAG TPA: hypothetical protein VL171_12700, partial [Verrucomicrobiae bacterium]|nr:hypothetical protein [Verrucomicrobiae bacterium]
MRAIDIRIIQLYGSWGLRGYIAAVAARACVRRGLKQHALPSDIVPLLVAARACVRRGLKP